MPAPLKLTKKDARRALVLHHFRECPSQMDAFERLRSIQFDPIAPVGCNHDLVLQARVPGYKIGEWEKTAYEDRLIYDGWDKQASLVPFKGWPMRRIFHTMHREWFGTKIFEDHKEAVALILKELEQKGPLMPKDFDFQLRKEEWKVSWLGPSVTKQTLRALWHTGLVMTTGRRKGQHLYDLTERVVPREIFNAPRIPDAEAKLELALERHRAMGIVKPVSAAEVWSYQTLYYDRKILLPELVKRGSIVPIDIEGISAHATPEFITLLERGSLASRVLFVAPLDPLLWDRRMTSEIFGFDYIWEIYTPVVKRKWGYYVLPVLYGNDLVARVEFWARKGVLEIREWHFETKDLPPAFFEELERALCNFMSYSSCHTITCTDKVDVKIRSIVESTKN